MRKTVLLLAPMALALELVSGVAWAASMRCHGGLICRVPKTTTTCPGLRGRDRMMYAYKGHDRMSGEAGADKANPSL